MESKEHISARMLGYSINGVHLKEVFTFICFKENSHWNFIKIHIYLGDKKIGWFEYSRDIYKGYQPVDEEYDTMEKVSKWWRSPPPIVVDIMYRRALRKSDVLQVPVPGVAWLLYTIEGKLVTSLRAYADANGMPNPHAGKLDLPGGRQGPDETVLPQTLQRKVNESHHRKLLDVGDYSLVDKVYHPDDGHMVHVYNINPTFETLLLRQEGSRGELLNDLFQTENLGHPQFWRRDITRAFEYGAFVPYVPEFFKLQPEYLPDERPAPRAVA